MATSVNLKKPHSINLKHAKPIDLKQLQTSSILICLLIASSIVQVSQFPSICCWWNRLKDIIEIRTKTPETTT